MRFDIIAIGSTVKDNFIITDRGRLYKTPKDRLAPIWLGFESGEKICADELRECLGGVAATIATAAGRLGLHAAPLSSLGSDETSAWLLKELRDKKVDTRLITHDPTRTTAESFILSDKTTGERVIFYAKSSGRINLGPLSKNQASWYFVSSLTGNWRDEADIILAAVKRDKAQLALAPSTSQLRDGFQNLKRMLRLSSLVFINRNEALEIAYKLGLKHTKIKDLAKMLHDLGPSLTVITDGTDGAYTSFDSKIYHCPALKVKTIDMTGAGDSFAGTFLTYYAQGENIETCLKAGIINSASVVKQYGTTSGLLAKDALSNLFRKLIIKEVK